MSSIAMRARRGRPRVQQHGGEREAGLTFTRARADDVVPDVLFVGASTDTKTGPIVATYRSFVTCPVTCRFRPDKSAGAGGCYGTGKMWTFIANKWSRDTTVGAAVAKVRKTIKPGTRLMRAGILGDLVTPNGRLDVEYLRGVATVADTFGLQVMAYSHALDLLTPDARSLLRSMGITVNASTETVESAARMVRAGWPVVIASHTVPEGTMVEGKRVVTCPAETRTDVTCESCRLCWKNDRACIVRLSPHGPAHQLARRSIEQAEAAERMP